MSGALVAMVALFRMPSAFAADIPIAVLGVEAADTSVDQLATALTDALRQRVSGSKGYRLMPGRDLMEVKLVFSCPDEAPSCMAQAARSLGAAKLLFGSVKKSGGDAFMVTLKMLDAAKGTVDALVAEQITRAQASGPAIRGPVQKWFANLTGQVAAVGTLRLRSDVPGTSVAIDGVPSGQVAADDLVVPGVTAGRHELLFTKPGYDPVRREVTVGAGETQTVKVSMDRSAGLSAAPPASDVEATDPVATPPADMTVRPTDESDRGGSGAMKAASWAVFGAGLIGVGLGVKFSLDVKRTNEDLDPYRRFTNAQSPTGYIDARGLPASATLDPADREKRDQLKTDGKRFQTLQYVAYGVGGALLATSAVLFYNAYFSGDGSDEARAPSRLAVVPVFSPDGAGFSAALRF